VNLPAKALPLLLAALLVAGPLLIVVSALPASTVPTTTAMKRVPQHLITPDPQLGAGVPQVEAGPSSGGSALGTRASGTDPVIVIPIEFQDVTHAGAHNTAYFDSMMNGPSPSVNGFYQENSYGTFGLQATVAGWVRSAHTMAYYGQDGSGVDDATGPIYRLTVEAVQLAHAAGVNFANFDSNPNDGVVDHVVIVHAGGAQEASPNTNLIWSHRWAVIDGDPNLPGDQRLVEDSKQIYGYAMISEDSPVGVLAHEFGHDLGLPDLYDTDSSSLGIGVWDVMGSGSWNGNPRGTSPSDFSAWSKVKLGWVTPIEVTAPLLSQRIAQVENNSVVYRLTIKTASTGDEYLLVENRERVGFDAAQPGSGLLIYHVDDSVPNNDNEAHRKVDILEADEASAGDTPNDAGDPWASNAVGLGPDTNPNSNGYGNIRTGWKVRNIGAAGTIMVADLSREVDDDLAILKVTHPTAVAVNSAVNVFVTVRNQGARTQPNVNVTLRVFLNSLAPASEVNISNGRQSGPGLNTTQFEVFTWTFTASSQGRYILDARVDLAGDEILENNERLGHVTSLVFVDGFQDDVESGMGLWNTPGQGALDAYRWAIVDDSSPYGKSHSPTHAWRFGYYGGIPNLMRYHYLDSRAISVTGGPLYLVYYQSYDLSRIETPTANETDNASVEVMAGAGPWQRVAFFQGKGLPWQTISVNLTPYLGPTPTTLRLRFNATSSIMPNTGGWWVDDIFLSATNLSRAVAVLPVVSDRTVDPGAEAVFTFKLVNIGDYDDTFRFSAALPSGWTAVLVTNSTSVVPVGTARVPLAPDAETSLQFRVVAATSALRGTVETIPLTATSANDAGKSADFVATARVADPLGLGGIQKYIVWIILLGIALIVIVILVDHAKSRKFRGHLR